MNQFKRNLLIILTIGILFFPFYSLAESDYETGDGWIYQDGELKISDNGGLKDFISNNKSAETGEWRYQHSILDVNCLVIGKDVTDLTNEIYEWGQITPSRTIIEQANNCFIIENGWIVNAKTNTLYGAADVVSMQSRSQIDDIPNQVEHIGNGALFNYREATSISIPNNVTSIGNQSFMWCQKLSSFEFPMKLQTVGFQAFEGCYQLERISLGDSVSYVDVGAFSTCTGIKSIDIHNTKLYTISSDLFGATFKLKVLELPEHVFRIETLAFRICYELNTLIINSSNLMIEEKAFLGCDRLNRIIFTKGTPKSFADFLFDETEKTPDGKSYISNSYERRGEIISYPTLYYTAAYADEWAPNGETEWNGYTIQQISQEELDAILAEARGESIPVVTGTTAPTVSATTEPEPTVTSPDKYEPDQATSPTVEILLLSAIAVVAVGIAVFAWLRKRKTMK